MTIEQLAYISEIISGIVVATTLIILVLQMRQSNRREQSEALRETVNDFISGIVQATATEYDAENFRNGVHNFDELSSNEKARFHSTMLNMAAGFDQVLNLYKTKRLGKTLLTTGLARKDANCRTIGFQIRASSRAALYS